MQITEYIHALKIPFFVDGPAGRKIPRFVYCYLIFGREIWLIDSGVAGSEKAIAEYLEAKGRSIQEISTLILTHSHPDHIGAAAAIRGLSGCAVLAHEDERSWIEDVALQEEQRPVPGFSSLVGGSVSVDRTVQDKQVLHLNAEQDGQQDGQQDGPQDGLALQVLHTPGHSGGSISLWMKEEGALFSADAVPVNGDMPIYQDYSASMNSVERLAALPGIEHLLAAWDRPRSGGEAHGIMDQALQYLERIHGSVLLAAEADPAAGPMQICRSVLGRLGLPEFMANPLVAASFQSSLKAACEDEERIVWLKDSSVLAGMGYVREKWQCTAIRTGPARTPPGETLIGYAALKKTARRSAEKGFYRRIFTLRPEDRFFDQSGAFKSSIPQEGIDPLQVVAGRPGKKMGQSSGLPSSISEEP